MKHIVRKKSPLYEAIRYMPNGQNDEEIEKWLIWHNVMFQFVKTPAIEPENVKRESYIRLVDDEDEIHRVYELSWIVIGSNGSIRVYAHADYVRTFEEVLV